MNGPFTRVSRGHRSRTKLSDNFFAKLLQIAHTLYILFYTTLNFAQWIRQRCLQVLFQLVSPKLAGNSLHYGGVPNSHFEHYLEPRTHICLWKAWSKLHWFSPSLIGLQTMGKTYRRSDVIFANLMLLHIVSDQLNIALTSCMWNTQVIQLLGSPLLLKC
jgi:hypothetical protein